MTQPTAPPFVGSDDQRPIETWPSNTVFQKIQEALEDYENGRITEEELVIFLEEIHKKDEEHFLDKMDEYNEDLRHRLEKISLAKLALDVAGIIAVVTSTLAKTPGMDENQKNALNKTLNEQLLGIKDLGDAKQVAEGIDKTAQKLHAKLREVSGSGAEKLQHHINSMKDIAMGIKADYLGSTRTSLGTGTVLQGPLGEILGLGFDKLQVEADNDGAKYISGFISTQRNELSTELRATANHVKNRPQLLPPD